MLTGVKGNEKLPGRGGLSLTLERQKKLDGAKRGVGGSKWFNDTKNLHRQ